MLKGLIQRLIWLLLLVWSVGLVLIGAKFAQNNPIPIKVDLIIWTSPEISSGLALSLTLLFGLLLGVLMFAPVVLIHRARLRRLAARVAKFESDVQPHPSAPLRN
jgi:uncharacterized integral membrane protein